MRTQTFTAALLLVAAAPVAAQQPTPLINSGPLAPPQAPSPPPAAQTAPIPPPAPAPTSVGRDFCGQTVTAQPTDPASVPEPYRQFVGIFSDADWNPQTCAALIVEKIGDDGTATITYAFGPIAAGGKIAGGVLRGTGVVKDGALLFQNSDGSQYAFKPYYSDLSGHWTTPTGQSYDAIFKRAF
jgi:hypothetical protein